MAFEFFDFLDDLGGYLDTAGTVIDIAGGVSQFFAEDPGDVIRRTTGDPSRYTQIGLPGVDQSGFPTVDLPKYPDLPTFTPGQQDPFAGELAAGTALGEAGGLLNAILDPNSPVLQRLAREETEIINKQFTKGLRNIISANRRERARGRRGLLDVERGEQNSLRALMEAASEASLKGRTTARNLLTNFHIIKCILNENTLK